jgi:hypothetical protein
MFCRTSRFILFDVLRLISAFLCLLSLSVAIGRHFLIGGLVLSVVGGIPYRLLVIRVCAFLLAKNQVDDTGAILAYICH